MITAPVALELVVLAAAVASAVLVRPWRLLAGGPGSGLAMPMLAMLIAVPWLWGSAATAALPGPLQWSGAPLAVLVLGWPLAVPVLVLAGLSTIAFDQAHWQLALATTIWSGIVPATLVLLLGQAVRATLGTTPAAYLMARAYAVPLLALFASNLGGGLSGTALTSVEGVMLPVAAFLLAMGGAAWTCGVATLLVACRPQWLATWSDSLYLSTARPA